MVTMKFTENVSRDVDKIRSLLVKFANVRKERKSTEIVVSRNVTPIKFVNKDFANAVTDTKATMALV